MIEDTGMTHLASSAKRKIEEDKTDEGRPNKFNIHTFKQCSKIRIKEKVTHTVIVSLREIINIAIALAKRQVRNFSAGVVTIKERMK